MAKRITIILDEDLTKKNSSIQSKKIGELTKFVSFSSVFNKFQEKTEIILFSD